MDEIKEILQTQLAGTIDFKGQATAEKYLNLVIYGGVALSVLVGFFLENFDDTLVGLGATYVASLIFSLPIPAYRRNPVKFLDPSSRAFPNLDNKIETTK